MTKRDEAGALRELANRSGFVFQLAVETNINSTREDHEWSVLSVEHAWEDKNANASGYIDLVLGQDNQRLIVECKKRQDKSWIFLCPRKEGGGPPSPPGRVRAISTLITENQTPASPHLIGHIFCGLDFPELQLVVASPEAKFCIAEDDRLLEGIARNLLLATEAVASEELPSRFPYPGVVRGIRKYYLPLIITNARLFACHLTAAELSPADPFLKGSEEFEEVPLVRFRKSFVPPSENSPGGGQFAEINAERERTVLVASSAHLSTVLANLAGARSPSQW